MWSVDHTQNEPSTPGPSEHVLDVMAMVAGPITPDLMMEFRGAAIDRDPDADILGLGLVYYVVIGADGVVTRMT